MPYGASPIDNKTSADLWGKIRGEGKLEGAEIDFKEAEALPA